MVGGLVAVAGGLVGCGGGGFPLGPPWVSQALEWSSHVALLGGD